MKIIFAGMIATMVFATFPSFADSLPINAGLWESTVTTTSSFAGTQTNTNQECLVSDEFDPAQMLGSEENCEITESTLSGDTLTFSMVCDMQGGQGAMTGLYQSDGDIGSGTMKMEMTFGQQTMTMDSEMTAKRLGDC